MATADILRPQSRPAEIASGDAQVLEGFLARAARRRNAQVIARHVTRALIPAVIGSTLGVLAYRFYLLQVPENITPALLPITLILGAAGVGAILGWRRRAGLFETAREADTHFKLHDLLASAFSFARPQRVSTAPSTSGDSMPFVPPLVSQAAQATKNLPLKELYPLRFDRSSQVLGVSLLALLGSSVMKDNPYFLSPEQKQLNATLQKEGEKLKRAAKAAREDKKLSQNTRAQIAARRLEALAQKMQGGRISKKQALLGLDQLKRELDGASKPNASTPSPGDMQKLRDALASGSYQTDEAKRMQAELKNRRDPDAAAKLDDLARKLEKNSFGNQQQRDKAANDLEEAARALRRAGEQNDQAARQIEEAAKSLRQNQNPNQQQGQQNQQGQQQGQQGQNSQQQGQQGQQGQQQNQQGGQQGSSGGASNELRKMAENLRSNGGGSSDSVREMMKRIEEAENSTGGAGSSQENQQGGQQGQGQQGQGQGQNGQGQGKGQGQGQGKSGAGKGQNGSGQGQSPGQGEGGSGDGRQGVSPGQDLKPSNPTKGHWRRRGPRPALEDQGVAGRRRRRLEAALQCEQRLATLGRRVERPRAGRSQRHRSREGQDGAAGPDRAPADAWRSTRRRGPHSVLRCLRELQARRRGRHRARERPARLPRLGQAILRPLEALTVRSLENA
jgi:hypothetical protein